MFSVPLLLRIPSHIEAIRKKMIGFHHGKDAGFVADGSAVLWWRLAGVWLETEVETAGDTWRPLQRRAIPYLKLYSNTESLENRLVQRQAIFGVAECVCQDAKALEMPVKVLVPGTGTTLDFADFGRVKL